MRDPRAGDGGQSVSSVIRPWLAVTGGYSTSIDTPEGEPGTIYRSIGISGGMSLVKTYHRTTVMLAYGGSGYRGLGKSGDTSGWLYSNVVNLVVGSQISKRLTLNFGESAGAANGGYGYGAWSTTADPNGVLGTIGSGGSWLYGGTGLPQGVSINNPLNNNLVDKESSNHMVYFSDTNASLGVLLSASTMLSFEGGAFLTRRPSNAFSETNGYTGATSISKYWTQRLTTFADYSFTRYDYINSIGTSNINGVSGGVKYQLSPRDMLTASFGASFVNSQFLTTITLPADVAKQLGVPVVYYIANVKQNFLTGSAFYSHRFHSGGLGLGCSTGITPGNDLLVMTRNEECNAQLSGTLTRRMSVSALAAVSRLDGLAMSGTRYDAISTGMTFSYRFLRGLSFTAGASYSNGYVKPSTARTSYVSANAGLYWSPERGLKLF